MSLISPHRSAEAAGLPGAGRVALVSLHTSPLAGPGAGDAGGMNVYLRGVAGALSRRGVRVDLFTRAASDNDLDCPDVRLSDGASLHRLEAGPPFPLPKGDLAVYAERFAREMARFEPADVIHSHYWLSGLAGARVAAEWGVPHVQSLHTVAALKNRVLAPGDTPEPAARIDAERRLVREAAEVVVVSDAERDAIIQDYGVDPDRIRVVSPGVNPEIFKPGPAPAAISLPEALRRPQGYVLMVGRVQPIKGQDLAIRALAALDPAVRPALLLSGAAGTAHQGYAESLRGLAEALGVADDVVFCGAQSQERLVELIRGGRATLMPSWSETYGMVAVESAAVGTPVIAADTTGLRSSVSDGVSGLLVAGRDPAVWAAAIAAVLGDPALRERLSRGGAALGRSRTWDHAAQGLLAGYGALARP
jgi:D-inositol-3-phosphate glycosyltransferase